MKYIGVDLGGTNIVVGLIKEDGTIIKTLNKPTLKEREGELIFDDIIGMCELLISEFELDEHVPIGIGVPGSINIKEGIIGYANNLNLSQFNGRKYIEDRLNRKVSLANDADCAALGEVIAGGAKGCSDAVILTLGTGVGGGIIIEGKVFAGFYEGGAEIGHQIIERNGRACTCGNKGCLESYASATALILAAKEKALENPNSLLYSMVEGQIEKMNAKIPFDAAQAKDEVAMVVIDEYIEYLAIGIANTINVFKPQMILLGGGVSRQGDHLIKPLTKKVKKMVYGKEMPTVIKIATLGNDAGLIGAAMLNKA